MNDKIIEKNIKLTLTNNTILKLFESVKIRLRKSLQKKSLLKMKRNKIVLKFNFLRVFATFVIRENGKISD